MAITPDFPIELSSTVYPKVYRTALGWRLVLLAVGGVSIAAALVIGYLLNSYRSQSGVSPPQNLWLSLLALALLGAYAIARALRFRVVLSVDRIEIVEPLGRRQMLRTQIQGRRLQRGQYCATLDLVPQDRKADHLWIPLVFKTDNTWREWFAAFSDLDAEEIEEAEQTVIQRRYPYLPLDEGVWQIARLRRLAGWVNAAAILLILAASPAIPTHLTVAACILLPLIAVSLVARFQPLYRFGRTFNEPYPSLLLALILPGLVMILALTETYPIHPLNWPLLLLLATLFGFALTGGAIRADPWSQKEQGNWYLIGVMLWPYGFGAALGLNALGDYSVAQIYPVTVLSKHVSTSSSTTYSLRVTPWGPLTYGDAASVSRAVYRSVTPGETVCVYLKHGAFHVPWYRVDRCDADHPR
jgi:hypothetical protein